MQKILGIILFSMKYKIYTDGACSGNPGSGGWAAIIILDNKIKNIIFGKEKNNLICLYFHEEFSITQGVSEVQSKKFKFPKTDKT